MIHCGGARRLFGVYWDDEITLAERDWLEAHFSACTACRGEYEQFARTIVDVHPSAAFLLDELFVDELLVRLQDRDRIEPVLGGDVAHRGKRIAFVENAVEDERDDTIAKLAVDRLTVVPFTFHSEGARLR